MNEADLLELLNGLERALENAGLGAIVEQERRAVSEGRIIETTRKDVRRARSGGVSPQVGDLRVAALSAADRISILLDLLEIAVAGSLAVEERVRTFAAEEFDAETREAVVAFSQDYSEGLARDDDAGWILGLDAAGVRRQRAVGQILVDLAALRTLVGVTRAAELAPSEEAAERGFDRLEDWL